MQSLLLLVLAIVLTTTCLYSQTEKPKWDVNDPAKAGGVPYHDIAFTASEGTWMCLDVSPDGKTIAFDLLGDLYTMPMEGARRPVSAPGWPGKYSRAFHPMAGKSSLPAMPVAATTSG